MLRYGLLLLLGIGLPLTLLVTQTGTTRIRCDRRPTGTLCQQEQTLLYGLVTRPQRSLRVRDVRLDEWVRSANDSDRTYTIYRVYLDTDQGEVIFESTRNQAIAEQKLAQVRSLLGGEAASLTHIQGSWERTIAATVTAIGMMAGAIMAWLRAKP